MRYETINCGFVEGVLEILPTTKGDSIMVGESDLMWLLNQFNGKDVQITISEMKTTSTYQSSEESTQ